jgi:uncharacterized membrane protein YgaE (UPF0421/DUF939 family)
MWKFNIVTIVLITLLACAAALVAPFVLLNGFFTVLGGLLVATAVIKFLIIPAGKTALDIAVPTKNQR